MIGNPAPQPWASLVEAVADRCAPAGLDLVYALRAAWYNDAVAEEFRLTDLGRAAALAILIGNTRALWPRFLDTLRADETLRGTDDPLETYVERAVHDAVAHLGPRCEIRWSHETEPAPVAMQRLAEVAGLAALAPSHLSVHPVYGPWISLRAVVIVDVDGPSGPPPRIHPPCDDCEHHCMAAFERALEAAGPHAGTHTALASHWKEWLAVRDACPTGRAHRFDDDQVRYHYTKDRAILHRLAGYAG